MGLDFLRKICYNEIIYGMKMLMDCATKTQGGLRHARVAALVSLCF